MRRRGVALEKSGRIADAFLDIRSVLRYDPNNKDAIASARRLAQANAKLSAEGQSVENRVKSMLRILEDYIGGVKPERPVDDDTYAEQLVTAANNLMVLAREESQAGEVVRYGVLDKILPLLEDDSIASDSLKAAVGRVFYHVAQHKVNIHIYLV